MILLFWILSFKPTFSLSSFTFIKRLFSSCLLFATRVVSAYLSLLVFLQTILILPCDSSSPAFHMKNLMLKVQYFGQLMWRTDSLEKTLMVGQTESRRRRGQQRMRNWMASPWVWVNSGSCWWTGRPGVLQATGLQRVGHDWATELNWALQRSWISGVAISSLDVLLSQFWTSPLFHVRFSLLLLDLRTNFSAGR